MLIIGRYSTMMIMNLICHILLLIMIVNLTAINPVICSTDLRCSLLPLYIILSRIATKSKIVLLAII